MRMIFVVYERMTALDVVGPYEVLSRLPGADVSFAGARRGPVRTDTGALALHADLALSEVTDADLVLVPGGPDVAAQLADEPLQEWLRALDATTTWTTSVCTGSLILAAAGLLRGRPATSHWMTLDLLAAHGAVPTDRRVVCDGKYATAAGVSAGIDLALTLAARIAGDDVAQRIQLAVEYDPDPPFRSGSVRTAPPAVVEALRANAARVFTS